MKWREKDHLNVDGMNRIAQSMTRWMSIIKCRQDTHTTQYLSVCHRTWKELKEIDRCALGPKWVLAERCVCWPINDHDSEYTLCFTSALPRTSKFPSSFSPLTHANGSQSGFRRTRVAPRLKWGRVSRCILKWYGRAKKGVDVSGLSHSARSMLQWRGRSGSR
jgi:hypothetical protein